MYSIVVKVTYHNNRTEQQSKAVISYLINQGIAAGNLSTSYKAIMEAVPENRKTKVNVTVRQ